MSKEGKGWQSCEVGICVSLQKLREVESFAQGYTVNKWQNWDLNSSESESKACALSVPLSDGLPLFPGWPGVRLACCPPWRVSLTSRLFA